MSNPLTISSVSKVFKEKGKPFHALKDVSLTVRPGEIFSLLGPNGSGKTTLLNIISGILLPDSGSVSLLGKNPFTDRSVAEKINIVSGQARYHWSLTCSDILNFYARIYRLPAARRQRRIQEVVDFFGLKPVFNRKFAYLSTGERMRLRLAKGLINQPQLLLMDEPTLGLDPNLAVIVRDEILRIQKVHKTTVLLTSHYMHEVEQLADRIAFIYKGEIVDTGTIEETKLRHFSEFSLHLHLNKSPAILKKLGFSVRGLEATKTLSGEEGVASTLAAVHSLGFRIHHVEIQKPTLEDYFIRVLKKRVEEDL